MDWVNAFLWFAVMFVIGFSLIEMITSRCDVLFPMEKMALSFPVGVGVISLCFGLAAMFNVWLSKVCIWIIAFIFASLYLFIKAKNKNRTSLPRGNERTFSAFDYFCLISIAIQSFYNVFRAIVKPWSSHDFLEQFGMKAKIFYLAGGIPSDYIATFKGVIPNLQYPPMLIFSQVSFYIFQGRLNDVLVSLMYPLFYICLLILFYCILKRFTNSRIALLFTFLLSTIKQVSDYGSFANKDIILAFYFFACVFFLYLWLKESRDGYLGLSLVLSILIMYTKTEGILLLSINSVILSFYILLFDRKRFKKVFLYICVAVVLMGSYVGISQSLELNVHDDFKSFQLKEMPSRLISGFKRLPQILYSYQKNYFGPKKWNIIWPLFFISLLIHFRKLFNKDHLVISLWLFLMFVGYTCVYLMTESLLSWQISTTLARFLIHGIPLVVFLMALLWKDTAIDIFKNKH